MILRYRRALITIMVILLSLLLHHVFIAKQLLELLQLRTYDLILDLDNAFAEQDGKPVFEQIVIVDIDEESIAKLGQYSTWPNLYFADLVDSLANDKPLLIAFDVFFTESDSLNAYAQERITQHLESKGYDAHGLFDYYTSDADLARAMRDAGNVYLAMFNSAGESGSTDLPDQLQTWQVAQAKAVALSQPKAPIPLLAEAASGLGFAHIEPDISGFIHDYPLFFQYQDSLYVNFSFQACLDLLGIDEMRQQRDLVLLSQGRSIRKLPLDSKQRFFLNYYGKAHRFRYISLSDVLSGRIAHPFFEDKIVLVGASAAGLRDIKSSPLAMDYPGVELHATFMQNVLSEDFVHWLPLYLSWLIASALVVLMAFGMRYLRPLQSLFAFAVASLLLFIAFFAGFAKLRLSMDYSVYLSTWVLGYFSLLINESQLQYAEKKRVRYAFEHYVSKSVISQIMKVDNPLRVGGVRKSASIMFSDIRDFSSICEKLPAEEVGDFLHTYFNRCTRVVTQNFGILDKYIGDAMLALFNVPIEHPNYQYDACHAAMGIVEESRALRQEYAEHPILRDFKIGIGIASGEIIAGNFGSDEIFNYTGIGDKMNLASRLESLNKIYLSSIIIDHETYLAVKGLYLCRWLDRVCVKGKGEAVDIYELICAQSDARESQIAYYQLYAEGLQAMIDGHRERAEAVFNQCQQLKPEDYPAQLMLKRGLELDWTCWDGVFHHDHK